MNKFLVVLCVVIIAQAAIYMYARLSERTARKTYWASPTIAQVQRRYKFSRWSLIAFMVLLIAYLLIFLPSPGG